jgi:DnaA-homolog protein
MIVLHDRMFDGMSDQLPLALRFPADQRFELWVGNAEAAAACKRRVAQNLQTPLLITGAQGSGKTHLLLASCAMATQVGIKVRYLPLQAVRDRLSDVLGDVEHAQLIAVDQLEVLVGDKEKETALFHLHNRAHDAGVSLIYASSLSYELLEFTLPDLRSRISQCERISLQLLTDDERRDVLRVRAQMRGLEIDNSVLDYVFSHVSRDLITLTVMLDRLDRASLAAKRRITIPFVKTVIAS